MVESIFKSLEGLAIALSLKTAFMALISTFVAKRLSRMSLRRGFWLSQLLGPVFLIPLYFGIKLQLPILFLFGITVGGLPGLILSIVGTAYFRLASENGAEDFRKNQGKLQIIVGLCFVAAALSAPLMLKYLSYDGVILIDLLSYAVGSLFVVVFSKSLQAWDSPIAASSSPNAGERSSHAKVPQSYFTASVIVMGIALTMAYLLKGLPPMIAGSTSLTTFLDLEKTARQTLWGFEALAAIAAGLAYQRHYGFFNRLKFFEVGLFSGVWLLPLLAFQNYFFVAAAIFFLSFSMTMTFMKLRDDFISSFKTKDETYWATGYVNFVMNFTLTISPLLIGLATRELGLSTAILTMLAVQSVAYFGCRMLKVS